MIRCVVCVCMMEWLSPEEALVLLVLMCWCCCCVLSAAACDSGKVKCAVLLNRYADKRSLLRLHKVRCPGLKCPHKAAITQCVYMMV